MEHGDGPEHEGGADRYPPAPLPPHERVWRHPSELGGGQLVVETPAVMSRGLAAGAAVLSLLLVAGLTRLMLPGDAADEIQVVAERAEQRAPAVIGTLPTTTLRRITTSAAPATVAPTVTDAPVDTNPDPSADTAPVTTTIPGTITQAPPEVSTTVVAPQTALVGDVGSDPSMAVEVQPGTLYVTTSAAVGTSRTTPVQLASGETLQADVLMVDEDAGIAVLLVASETTPATEATLPPRTDDEPAVGDAVTVLGASTDDLAAAVLDEAPSSSGDMALVVETDPGIEVGEGAPVLDDEGNLLGLCTSSGELTWMIPADALVAAVEASLSMSESTAWLGITAERDAGSVVVSDVEDDSPAAASGVAVGDVIVGFEDRPVLSLAELALDMARHVPGDEVDITIERDGTTMVLAVVLGERPPGA